MKRALFLGYIIFMFVAPFIMWWATFEHHHRDLANFTKVQFVFLWGVTFIGIMAGYAAYLGYKDWLKHRQDMAKNELFLRAKHELEHERWARSRKVKRHNSYMKFIRSNADMDRPE